MTTEELMAAQREQFEAQTRQQALSFAQQRAKPDAAIEDIIAEAEKLVAFVVGGVTIATPAKQA